ncbi:MAG: enoyl-CoA hydratase/isomerase family protein, partial [Stellaceae bacterium]
MSDDEILLGRAGGLATITLNRPQALNALTLANYRRIAPALRASAEDPSVHAVLVRGAGGRAFCAGGDVRAVWEAGRGIGGTPDLTAVFFREEYQLIREIHRFPKPYIAIIDGITMGGGAGISVNGAYRVATPRTLLAMPETAIGLFPDVGATRFLNRCPGHIGRYLGLGSARLRAADALYCGFATHVLAEGAVKPLVEAIGRTEWRAGAERQQLEAALSGLAIEREPAPLAALRPAIDRCFAGDTIEAILAALAAEATDGGAFAPWAAATHA